MAKKKRYIVSHSNYVLKQKHQNISGGTVYEKDYMTIESINTFAPGQVKIFNESNFKFTVRNGINKQLKHRYGTWDKRDLTCEDYSDPTIWTANCLGSDTISDDSKITLKPNYTSLLDFAYYGSCINLIESSITDIINKFPAELFLSDEQIEYYVEDTEESATILGGDDKYLVKNPFEIDLLTKSITNTVVDNELRYFCSSYSNYSVYNDKDEKIADIDWNVSYSDKWCKDGDLIATIDLGYCKLYSYYLSGKKILLHNNPQKNIHIRPSEEKVDSFYSKLDDFQKLLVKRDSNPKYKIILDTPQETDTGVFVYKKAYTFPILNGWNLDISTVRYNTYLKSLLNIAQFYDEYYTDNMWRMLTHDSLKNLDFTYKKENSDTDENDYALGTSHLESILKVYGRHFDDIKRYIDSIKVSNNITYDGKSNLPDYFLTDSLDLSGWEVINASPTTDNSISVSNLYPKNSDAGDKVYTATDANNEFLRRLKLNSGRIFKSKGTKNGIEMLLALFGLKKDKDYEINEYVEIAKPNNNDNAALYNDVKTFNSYKKSYFNESLNDNVNEPFQGLPVREVIFINNDGEEIKYLIPWFDKLQEIDGSPYFQMKGGWGKTVSKNIDLDITNVKKIQGTLDMSIYDETCKYLNIVRDLTELKNMPLQRLNKNDVYYVYDITDLPNNTKASHYFILKNIEKSTIISDEGWVNIEETDIVNGIRDGVRVLYLESIIDNSLGNNPHVGYGKYDDGEEYLDYFRKLFKWSEENDNLTDSAYDCDDNLNAGGKSGFELTEQKDCMKCWYFSDLAKNTNGRLMRFEKRQNGAYELYDNDIPAVGNINNNTQWTTYKTEINPYNFEGGRNNDEAAANSIINTKKLVINFFGNTAKECNTNGDYCFRDYITEKVMPYVKQLIPSTSILEVSIEGENAYYTCFKVANIAGVATK